MIELHDFASSCRRAQLSATFSGVEIDLSQWGTRRQPITVLTGMSYIVIPHLNYSLTGLLGFSCHFSEKKTTWHASKADVFIEAAIQPDDTMVVLKVWFRVIISVVLRLRKRVRGMKKAV